ncbi:MAG TPA: hypothetical protein VMF09_01375 [Solirubrobacteraceae bacterium]|nr:hypothetical protein [Solirubrobacteraceae bacterium]
MKGQGQQDPRPLVALIVGLAVASLLGAARQVSLAPVIALALPVLLGGLVLLIVLAAARVTVTRRSLASRQRLVVLAPDTFDPSLDTVVRSAAHLARARRLVGNWLDPGARAVRVLLDTDEEGRLRYSLSVPRSALPAVRSALMVYDRVQVRLEPDAAPPPSQRPVHIARAELRLARPSTEPLAHLPLQPDPLQSFARVLAGLDYRRGERAEVAIDLLPRTAGTRRRLRRRMLRDARRREGDPAAARQRERPRGRRRPAEMVEQRVAREELATKLVQAEPLFGLQVLVRCSAPERGTAVSCLHGLLACFDSMAGANSLRVVGVRVLGVAFLGSDLPGRRRWLDYRMRRGLFKPARRCHVTAREMAGVLKPPTVHCSVPEVLRLGPAVYPAPKTLPTFTGQRGLVPLGRVRTEDGERRVGLRVEDSFFSYIAGRSRWGKTELALTQGAHIFRAGFGGLFLDPHQDAVKRLKCCLTEQEFAQRIVELDLVGERCREGQPGWNLFACRGLDASAAERRVEAIVDSFASALQWGERNNRALTLTTQATGALIELSRILPEGLQPTIFQVPSILGSPEWLQAALPFLSPPRRQFFTERFPRLSEESITPVTNLIDRLRSSTPLAALLGAQTSTYDIARAMSERKIVLACPGADGARDRLVANLLVFDLLYGAKSRAFLAPEQRVPFYCFLDEIQVFDGASNGTLASLLEQTAKFGIRGILLNQNPERLTASTLNALTTNRSHLVTTALNSHAAGLIAREWGGDPPAGAITGLPRRNFIAQVTLNGEVTRPFRFTNESVEDAFGEAFRPDAVAAAQPAIDAASGRTSAAETIAALDTLDARIMEHLESRQGAGGRRLRSAEDSDQPWAAPAARRPGDGDCAPPTPASECSEQGRSHKPTRQASPVRDGEL